MKFEIKFLDCGGYELFEESDEYYLILLGDIVLFKENHKNGSKCWEYQNYFDYHGIEDALCRKESNFYNPSEFFTPKRILVIQMN